MKPFTKSILSLAVLALAVSAFAADGSSLKPPAGAKVAVVVFEDLECPSCAAAYPKIWEAANAYHVPVMLRDFPLGPKHPWSMEAAVWARFFDERSQKLGEDFRGYIFKNQNSINPGNLRQYVDKFAADNHIPVPFNWDPGDKLRAKVIADHDLGTRIGINETPTIFVVSNTESRQIPQIDQLASTIDELQKKAGPVATPAKHPASKKSAIKKKAATSGQ